MSISYLSLESSFGETAGLDGRDFIFALLLLLSLCRAAHEVLNPMPGETRGPQSFKEQKQQGPDCDVGLIRDLLHGCSVESLLGKQLRASSQNWPHFIGLRSLPS